MQNKELQDSTFTFRRFCLDGICGRWSMNINGEGTLARLNSLEGPENFHFNLPLRHIYDTKDLQ
jgi:succinate dehydrogenase/fumarate reductase-like Fe-S protein